MTDTYEIIYGGCEQDMFDGPGPNHRTYRADGHWYTGTESWDNAYACSPECKDALLASYGGTIVNDDDLPHDERMAIVGLAVRPAGAGWEDATVYELEVESIAVEQLPAVCAHDHTVLKLAPVYERAPNPPTVALVYNDDHEVIDEVWAWETGQNYAMHEGRRVIAIADEGLMTIAQAQAMYDAERARYLDDRGLPNTPTDHTHIWGRIERSHLAGTAHRKCLIEDCSTINAYDDDIVTGNDAYPYNYFDDDGTQA